LMNNIKISNKDKQKIKTKILYFINLKNIHPSFHGFLVISH